jgi:hypothetical protein
MNPTPELPAKIGCSTLAAVILSERSELKACTEQSRSGPAFAFRVLYQGTASAVPIKALKAPGFNP